MIIRTAVLLLALTAPPSLKFFDATPHGCVDGDTCTVDLHLGMNLTLTDQRVRLCDINAPEIRPRKSRAAGVASRNLLNVMVDTATTVQVAIPHTNDRPAMDNFGRLLGYIYADGRNLNRVMVDAGAAKPYPRKCMSP